MNDFIKKLMKIIALVLLTISYSFAQTEGDVDMAETMRSDGKIYVVILVIAIVFTGLVIFAFRSDKKISKLEKEVESLKSDKG